MIRGLVLPLVALAVLAGAASAQQPTTAGARLDPTRVPVGTTSDLAVVVQGTQSTTRPKVPAPDGLRVEYVGPETQVAILNGQVTSTVTHHFGVTASREGRYAMGPITVDVDGRTLSAGSVVLDVTPGAEADAGSAGLDLVASVPRTTVYVRERVPLTVQLRVGDGVRVTEANFPAIPGEGFSVEPTPQPTQREERTAAGPVQVVEFQTALVPARAGTLTVGPVTLSLAVAQASARRGFFFGGMRRETREVRSAPLQLEVLPLPEQGRPADFTGAVGRFALAASGGPLDVRAGDPVTLKLVVRGQGDLGGAVPPGVPAAPGLRLYPVQPAATQPPDAPGAGIERVFEQIVVPEQPGTVTLPGLRFAYFDPEARAYRVATAAPITLTVRAAPGAAEAPRIVGTPTAGTTAAPDAPLGRDIVHIKDVPGTLRAVDARRWRAPLFWLLQLVPLAAVAGVLAWDRRRRRLGSDVRWARFTAAGRAAREGLDRARAALAANDRPAFYDGLATTLGTWLAAKLDLPPGSVTPQTAATRLRAGGVPDALADEAAALLAACETARYAPSGAGAGNLGDLLTRAEAVIRGVEKTRGLARALGALALATLAAATVARAAETPEALFHRGNVLYADGRFADAAAAYGEVVAQGLESPALHFNLGNARLRQGDVGGAVASWERARRLAPGDPDVAANLGFVRPAGTAPTTPWWARLAFPLAGVLASDALLLVAATAWWLACAFVILGRVVPRSARVARVLVAVALVGVVVAGGSAAWRVATLEAVPEAVVTGKTAVTVRFEPAATGTPHFTVAPGTVLRVLGARDGWTQVMRPDGLRGWVETSALTTV